MQVLLMAIALRIIYVQKYDIEDSEKLIYINGCRYFF